MTERKTEDGQEGSIHAALTNDIDLLEQVGRCCEDMICEECGMELDAHTECECPCHLMV